MVREGPVASRTRGSGSRSDLVEIKRGHRLRPLEGMGRPHGLSNRAEQGRSGRLETARNGNDESAGAVYSVR